MIEMDSSRHCAVDEQHNYQEGESDPLHVVLSRKRRKRKHIYSLFSYDPLLDWRRRNRASRFPRFIPTASSSQALAVFLSFVVVQRFSDAVLVSTHKERNWLEKALYFNIVAHCPSVSRADRPAPRVIVTGKRTCRSVYTVPRYSTDCKK